MMTFQKVRLMCLQMGGSETDSVLSTAISTEAQVSIQPPHGHLSSHHITHASSPGGMTRKARVT